MGNTWFKFKAFTIHQDRCAMKVTTDSCLFGAWAANSMATIASGDKAATLLDIGTGTGLLTLMSLQLNPLFKAVAVELEQEAAGQAGENANASPWRENITVHQGDIKDFRREKPFDFIICNPPFHENQLAGENRSRNLAHHDKGLLLEELPNIAFGLAAECGHLFLLLPYYRHQEAIDYFKAAHWYLAGFVHVRQSEDHALFRTMFHFQKQPLPGPINTGAITIREGKDYSQTFSQILKPYYINM